MNTKDYIEVVNNPECYEKLKDVLKTWLIQQYFNKELSSLTVKLFSKERELSKIKSRYRSYKNSNLNTINNYANIRDKYIENLQKDFFDKELTDKYNKSQSIWKQLNELKEKYIKQKEEINHLRTTKEKEINKADIHFRYPNCLDFMVLMKSLCKVPKLL